MSTQQQVLDLVTFKLRDGVTREQFLDTVDPVSQWASRQPGFVSRELSYCAADDKWIEVVHWASQAEADAAAADEANAQECAPMFGMIDMESLSMLRGEPAVSVRA